MALKILDFCEVYESDSLTCEMKPEMVTSLADVAGVKEMVRQEYGLTAMEYVPGFDFQSLEPKVGNMFRFYIGQRYISPMHPPIAERELYGCTYYAPQSDLAAMAMHFGCLFFHSKRKSSVRRLNCVKNAIEICLCGESEYHKRCSLMAIPGDIGLKGIVVTICVENAPSHFHQVARNGIRSKDMQPTLPYCLRISHFYLVSGFDEMPLLVAPSEYVRQTFQPMQLRPGENGEVFVPFSPQIFFQLFTRLNIANGIFSVFRIFLLVGDGKMEVCFVEGTKMKVLSIAESGLVSDLVKKRISYQEEVAVGELHQFEANEAGLVVNGVSIGPVVGVIMVQVGLGKAQRMKDKLS
jgi:hypothetical protein